MEDMGVCLDFFWYLLWYWVSRKFFIIFIGFLYKRQYSLGKILKVVILRLETKDRKILVIFNGIERKYFRSKDKYVKYQIGKIFGFGIVMRKGVLEGGQGVLCRLFGRGSLDLVDLDNYMRVGQCFQVYDGL